MLIEELTRQESLDILTHTRLGRLACAKGSQPYVVPLYFAYDHHYLYSHSTLGQKIEWMRANPLVSVEVDEVVSPHRWVSVVVDGRYEELPDTPEWHSEREVAWKLLQRYTMWWEPAFAKTIIHGEERPLIPVFYRVHIVGVSGRRAILEPAMATETTPLFMPEAGRSRWLQKTLRLIQKRQT